MKIFIKFLLRNILEKKLRTLMILFSIVLSTALVFSTLAISGTVKEMMTSQLRKYTGSSEIVIQKNPQSLGSPFFELKEINEFDDKMDYMIGNIQGFALYPEDSEQQVHLAGFTLEDLETLYNVSFTELDESQTFSNNKAIIGEGEANKLGVTIGDTIELMINQQTESFTIMGIAKPEGIFRYDGENLSIIVPKDTLASIYDASGKVNTIYIKTNDIEVNDLIDLLVEKYQDEDDFMVRTTITTLQIEQSTGSLTSTFSLMLIVVVFISIFIIYTAFKVITMERLPIVGTFRSIGATKKMTDIVLLGESFIYGVIGGVLGCLLGVGILNIMINSMAYNPYTGVTSEVTLVFGFEHFLISFLCALILSVFSALFPIIKVSKMPVRNIVLNQIKVVSENKKIRFTMGLILLIAPYLILILLDRPSIIICGLCIILVGCAIVMLVPLVTKYFVYVFEKVNQFIFKNEGALAAKNLRDNKGIIQNITLLTIGIASLILVNAVTQSIMEEVVNVFSDAKFQLIFQHEKADETYENQLRQIEGIDDVNGNYTALNVKVADRNDYIGFVWGVDAVHYFKFWDFEFNRHHNELFNELSEGRNVIISEIIRNKLELEMNDLLTLVMNNQEVSFKVIGFCNSPLNNGNFIFMDENYLKQDAKINYMTDIMIKTNHPKDVIERIKTTFQGENINIMDMDEQKQFNIEQNDQMFRLLEGFSVVIMLIGTFGIFNNFVVSYISRKRSLAIYRSVGMSKNQVFKMLNIEALSCGIVGGLTGAVGGVLFIIISNYIMKAMFMPVSVEFSSSLLISAIFMGIIVSVLSALIPSLRSKKLSIIEAIKYE